MSSDLSEISKNQLRELVIDFGNHLTSRVDAIEERIKALEAPKEDAKVSALVAEVESLKTEIGTRRDQSRDFYKSLGSLISEQADGSAKA